MTKITDVARKAGVSVTTVSYVLNGKGNISEKTREHVLEVVKELGYTRSIRARNLRDRQSRVIGYAQSSTRRAVNPVLDKFLQRLVRQIELSGRYLLLFSADADRDLHVYQELIDSQRVDGFVISNANYGDKRFSLLHEAKMPFVAFGRSYLPIDEEVHWVDLDDELGIYEATTHLIQQGHRQIAIIAWPEGSAAGDARHRGYLRALQENGIEVPDSYLYRAEGGFHNGYLAAQSFFESTDQNPTAIVAIEDTLGIGALNYASQHGHKIAITGFDDIPASEVTHPALTTLNQPTGQIASILCDMLIQQLEGKTVENKHQILQPKLIVRASSQMRVGDLV